MIITQRLFASTPDSTLSELSIDDNFQCYTLEDGLREVKIPHETRIPGGVYNITVRTEGNMNQNYSERYDWHKGMLWIRDIPEFKWVYYHEGNYVGDTSGCVLPGKTFWIRGNNNYAVGHSREAYKMLYLRVIDSALSGDLKVEILR